MIAKYHTSKININSPEINLGHLWYYMKIPVLWKPIYDKLLIALSNIGVDLLKECNASCKGENREYIACWNMFQAACACYANHEISKANTLIRYICTKLKMTKTYDVEFAIIGYSSQRIHRIEGDDEEDEQIIPDYYPIDEYIPLLTTFDYSFHINVYKRYTYIQVPTNYRLIHLINSDSISQDALSVLNQANNGNNGNNVSYNNEDLEEDILIFNGEIRSNKVRFIPYTESRTGYNVYVVADIFFTQFYGEVVKLDKISNLFTDSNFDNQFDDNFQ